MDKKNIIIALAISSLLLGLTVTVSAEEDPEQTTEINVTIASEVALDVQPENLNFQNVNVGEQHNTSDGGFDGITVENIGSENIDTIWVESSMPDERPFGTGDATLYDSGNFIQVKPDFEGSTGGTENPENYLFVNRKEFDEPVELDYINAPIDEITVASQDAEHRHVGRFRNADEEVFWVLSTTNADNECNPNQADVELRVGQTPHTPEGLGTTDFTDDGEDYDSYTMENVDEVNYGKAETQVDLNYQDKTLEYDVFGICEGDGTQDTTHTIRSRYNVDPVDSGNDLTEGNFLNYIFFSEDENDMLLPGETFVLPTAIAVPTGVVEGEITTGTLTLLALSSE